MPELIHVVAGVISDAAGRILLTQRPAGKHLAGLWEFPGGKCEAGEAPDDALRRELREEIGVDAGVLEPLIAVPWHYPQKSILLDVYRVRTYAGQPHGRELQALQWVLPRGLAAIDMPQADRPVIAALRLPQHYPITREPGDDAAAFQRDFQTLLDSGWKFIQLRSKHRSDEALRLLAERAHEAAAAAGARLLLNGHVELVRELGLEGVHLPANQLMACPSRPLDAERWVGASCHDERELAHAVAIGVDFATLGPVLPTMSHPGATLGWPRFSELCADVPLPVYALGGLGPADLARAIAAGAQGIAGISAFWPG